MDIRYYAAREQAERACAAAAHCDGARRAHGGLADAYRRLLDHHGYAAAPL